MIDERANHILDCAADIFLLKRDVICGKSRKRYVTRAKQAVCYVLRGLGYKMRHVAAIVGYTDHSTAIYAANTAWEIMKRDKRYNERVKRLEAVYGLQALSRATVLSDELY